VLLMAHFPRVIWRCLNVHGSSAHDASRAPLGRSEGSRRRSASVSGASSAALLATRNYDPAFQCEVLGQRPTRIR
jgi:hypothetical protein